MSREDALRATIKTLDEKIEWQNKKIASEHELYLTAHRDNMKGATLLMEARSKLAASETNLEAASDEFKRLEYMAQEVAKERGEALAQVQALTRDRDEWKEATIAANERFSLAEEKNRELTRDNAALHLKHGHRCTKSGPGDFDPLCLACDLAKKYSESQATNAKQAREIERLKEQSGEWASHAGESDGRIAALESRERELVKERDRYAESWASTADAINQELRENGPADVGQYTRQEDTRNGVRFLVDLMRRKADEAKERYELLRTSCLGQQSLLMHERAEKAEELVATLQSEKSLLTKAVEDLTVQRDEKELQKKRADDLQRAVEELTASRELLADALARRCPCWGSSDQDYYGHNRKDCPQRLALEKLVALSPRQPQDGAKCSCGEPSPDRLVVHRKDGPCYLRPQPPEEGR